MAGLALGSIVMNNIMERVKINYHY